jgi:hypothetical protein
VTTEDLVRTHDAARDLLTYAVPGARVKIWRVRGGSDRARGYSVTVERLGHKHTSAADAYALPCPVSKLYEHAKRLAETAATAA